MGKQNLYNCVLYEPGDKVKERYGSEEVLEIEFADIRYVGIFPCQFLKFKGKNEDNNAFSNLYIPVGETEEKYKDGLKYFDEVKITEKKGFKDHTRSHQSITFKRQSNVLTEEDLKPKIIKSGFFTQSK